MCRLVTPLFFLLVGLGFLIGALTLPKSLLGDPNAPAYFPVMISVILIVLSIAYFFQEWKQRKVEFKELKELLSGRTPFLLVASLIMMLIYALLFERIGFLLTTIIFLAGLLFIVNGKKKWMTNILVSIIFSFAMWYSFGILLQVSLP